MTAEIGVPGSATHPPIFVDAEVPEFMPGEPERRRASAPVFVVKLTVRVITTLLLFAFTSWLWPIYLILVAIHGWAPNVPRLRQIVRYCRHVWTVRPPAPGLPGLDRCWLALTILRKCATVPANGVAWLLDEVLYGARLRATPVEAPLIEISAARSGSTQLARYLESDPHIVAPPMIQCLFPYLWLWRIVPPTIGRFVGPDYLRRRLVSFAPPEFRQRHEGDLMLTDTFDLVLMGSHLNALSPRLGPDVMSEDFAFGALAPHNRQLWERTFIDLLDGIARKTLLNSTPGPDARLPRFFVKGHFLCAADALERQYPDASFLTMIREPAPRLQSAINFLRAQPFESSLGPPPWLWLSAAITRSETAYCDIEQDWFNRTTGARRCVLRFSEYIRDLEGSLAKVYRECLDTPTLPDYVPRVHEPRERKNYLLNRSLAEVGIDEDALSERLDGYIAWCRGEI